MHVGLSQKTWARCMLILHDSNYTRGFAYGAFSDLVEKALDAYLSGILQDQPTKDPR